MRLVALASLLITFVACNDQHSAVAAPPAKGAPAKENPADAKAVLKELAKFYRQKKTFQVDFDQKMTIHFNGLKNTIESQAKITVERPNRIAMRQKDPQSGMDVVCDGKQLSVSFAPLNQYTQTDAPKLLDELLTNPLVMGGISGRGPLLDVFADDPFKTLMDGVTKDEYAGREKLGEAEAHHLKFEQDQFDWELWVAVGEQPLVMQAAFDMKKSLAAGGLPEEQLEDAQMSLVQRYKNWQVDKAPGADAFAFEPPAGAKKVDNFFGGPEGGEPEVSPLVGKPAPDVEQELLDGAHFSLKQQKGKQIVILDFWATWCGPCVQEMPLVAKVADEYREKGVALYCLNQGEESDTIREFLEAKKLKVTVSLDPEGEAGTAYGVQGIPMLVLVDKAGVVQSVHIGYSPQIGDTLKKEIDALLAGKDLAAEARRAREAKDADLPTEGLKECWSKPGAYTGVAVAADGKTIIAIQKQTADVYSASGEKSRSVKLAAPGGLVRCARLTGKEPGELLVFDVWSQGLTALNDEGGKLWSPPAGQGVDDVWAADLDGDGKDEVIVGYNGATGLHVFGSDGKERWADTSIGNVWHVTAGDLDGDGSLEVLTTSAVGQVHVFDAKGKDLDTFDPGIYANMLRVFRLPGQSAHSLFVAGGGVGKTQMAALSGKGDALWHADLPESVKHCESLAFAAGTTWAAVGCGGGLVCVIDVRTGEMIAAASQQGMSPQVAWVTADDKPVLVAATGSALNAWRIRPKDAGENAN
jgi:thiol-disulfide isomerase/thioredoxin